MARGKEHSPEQVVNLLRQVEVSVANGKTTSPACKEVGITDQTYYRWPKGVWRAADRPGAAVEGMVMKGVPEHIRSDMTLNS